jgi:hypothetical protein
LGDFANSIFIKDMKEKNIKIEPHHVILHCKYCEERNYATMKENCLSGGRYCSLPTRDDVKGERVLLQALYNVCLYQEAEKRSDWLLWGEYSF